MGNGAVRHGGLPRRDLLCTLPRITPDDGFVWLLERVQWNVVRMLRAVSCCRQAAALDEYCMPDSLFSCEAAADRRRGMPVMPRKLLLLGLQRGSDLPRIFRRWCVARR